MTCLCVACLGCCCTVGIFTQFNAVCSTHQPHCKELSQDVCSASERTRLQQDIRIIILCRPVALHNCCCAVGILRQFKVVCAGQRPHRKRLSQYACGA
jgi:hypothetical protein